MTTVPALTPDEWGHIFGRLGYGNPEGSIWFLGMEEGLGKPLDEALREFLERPQPIDTFEHMGLTPGTLPNTPTWRIMAKLARRLLLKAADWPNSQPAKEYVASTLGTRMGDTFLLEMLPLPARKFSRKPSGWPDQYKREETLKERMSIIRELAHEHRPRFVFCYGAAYWPHYEEIFSLQDQDFDSYNYKVKTKEYTVKIGMWEASTIVVLTPFFVPYKLPNRELGKVADLVEARWRAISGSLQV